jgi:hypothetical protein
MPAAHGVIITTTTDVAACTATSSSIRGGH